MIPGCILIPVVVKALPDLAVITGFGIMTSFAGSGYPRRLRLLTD
jgi:hypothetical protein